MRVLLLVAVAVGCLAQDDGGGDGETLALYASQAMGRCEGMRARALTLRNLLLVEL